MRTKSATRRKRLADLTCPVLSPTEVDWFVRLQSKHKQGRSTNWQAMLHEWNTTLIQMSLDPHRKHLCTGLTPKAMGQLERFEKDAYDAINRQNSSLSAAAYGNLGHSTSHPSLHSDVAPTLTSETCEVHLNPNITPIRTSIIGLPVQDPTVQLTQHKPRVL